MILNPTSKSNSHDLGFEFGNREIKRMIKKTVLSVFLCILTLTEAVKLESLAALKEE